MEWFLWGMVILVLGLAAVAGSGRLGGLPPTVRDAPVPELPDGPLTGDDVRRVQFEVTPRGYSMSQVDDLLARIAVQLDAVADDAAPGGAGERAESAIMDPYEFPQERREVDHGSNEAPHG